GQLLSRYWHTSALLYVTAAIGPLLPGSATYFTGTVTGLAGRLANREARHQDRWVAGRLAAVVAGAAVTALLVQCCSRAGGGAGVALCLVASALLPRR
ncbi:DUF1275 domain-containing protein, partial [Streptomyces hundungensis]